MRRSWVGGQREGGGARGVGSGEGGAHRQLVPQLVVGAEVAVERLHPPAALGASIH